jgi:predicted transcriptional regulator
MVRRDERTDQRCAGRRALLPKQDQEELVEIAREIEARRTGVYVMSDEERAAVREGLDQARRGEFVPDDEMHAFWKRYGVL